MRVHSLHRLRVTPKPCNAHWQRLCRRSERCGHFLSLLAQCGLMPKPKSGLALNGAGDPVELLDVF